MVAAHTSRVRRDDGSASPLPHELRLLPAWPEPFEVFAGNLTERILGRVVPVVVTSSAPHHGFWRDIDLQAPFPRRGMRDSVLAHVTLLGLLYAISIWPQASVHLAESQSYRAAHGYHLSPYLPALHGAPTHRRHGGKTDPVFARQEIRSLPDAPDNLRQTIVTPPRLKLQRDLELPNIVAFQPVPPAQPQAAISRTDLASLPAAVAHAPEMVPMIPRRALPNVRPSPEQPAPEVGSIGQRGVPDIAQLLPPRANPILPLQPRRVPPNLQRGEVHPAPEIGSLRQGGAPDIAQLLPPRAAPVLTGQGGGKQGSDTGMPQVVALSAHPAEAEAPLIVPEGNRRGTFAASPTGRPNATGTPGAGDASGAGAHEVGGRVNAPPGIGVSAPPAPAAAVASPDAPSSRPDAADPGLRSKLLAAMRTPALGSIPPRRPVSPETTRESSGGRSELENHVFAGRRSYTLVVNMPNLNSYIGSWIIRYVDRNQGLAASPIAAPEVVAKSDPAYPGDLIHDGIQGTVMLTAIIRADGSVSDIAVAKSLFPQLDRNAVEALSRWIFRPALKNGQAIDLDALITVAFRTKANGL